MEKGLINAFYGVRSFEAKIFTEHNRDFKTTIFLV